MYYSQAKRSRSGIAGRPASRSEFDRPPPRRRFDRQSRQSSLVISPTGCIRPPDRPVANSRSSFLNGRRLFDGSACAASCGRSPRTWDGLLNHQQLKSSAMAGRCASGCGGPIQAALDRADRPRALQAGFRSVLEADSIKLAAAAMVIRANCRLADSVQIRGNAKPVLHEDDLSQPIASSP